MWHMTPCKCIPDKTKLMSIMVSIKRNTSGHQYRHKLVQTILNENLPIDIYGNGCRYYSGNNQYIKGGFKENEPYHDYMFHIAIENMQTPHYFSEKLTNTLLAGCTPVYLGCLNINKYFPRNVVNLTGNIEKDLHILISILKDPLSFKKEIDIQTIKNKIYLLRNLDKIYNAEHVDVK